MPRKDSNSRQDHMGTCYAMSERERARDGKLCLVHDLYKLWADLYQFYSLYTPLIFLKFQYFSFPYVYIWTALCVYLYIVAYYILPKRGKRQTEVLINRLPDNHWAPHDCGN